MGEVQRSERASSVAPIRRTSHLHSGRHTSAEVPTSRRSPLAAEKTAARTASRHDRSSRPRGRLLSLLATLCVAGLTATLGLPAFGRDFGEDAAPPGPALGRAAAVQSMPVPSGAAMQSPVVDQFTVQRPAVAFWQVPVRGDLRDPFGARPELPVAGVSSFHRGQDVGAPCGRTIVASAAGTVVQAGWYGTYGNWVLIDHGNGIKTGYAHSGDILVRVGERVKSGKPIATVGSTGASTGCHLHFEVHINDAAVDPVPFLATRGVRLG